MKKKIIVIAVVILAFIAGIGFTVITNSHFSAPTLTIESSIARFLAGDYIWVPTLKDSSNPPYMDVSYVEDNGFYLKFPLLEEKTSSMLMYELSHDSEKAEDLNLFLQVSPSFDISKISTRAKAISNICDGLKDQECFLISDSPVKIQVVRIFRNGSLAAKDETGKWHEDLSVIDFQS